MSASPPRRDPTSSPPAASAAGIQATGGVAIVLAALSALLLRIACQLNYVDVDLFHEMALARAAFARGRIPRDDIFAYTPTLHPVVHHEWGTGVVLYLASMAGGGPGLLVLKYLLVAAIAFFTVRAARLRGATWESVILLAPVAELLVQNGLTTIRAQVFTLMFTALLMLFLEYDRRGKRLWIVPWLIVHVVWLNMHAGFVVGLGLLAVHWLEQVLRGKGPQIHLIIGGTAMAGLVLVNPWGVDYVHYLGVALTMKRHIGEWKPLFAVLDPIDLVPYCFALLLVVYCQIQLGWKKMHGVLIVALCAYLGLKTTRHATIFAVAWFAHVPAWVARTPLGSTIVALWDRRKTWIVRGSALVGVAALVSAVITKPFTLRMSTTVHVTDDVDNAYPAGVVDYLAQRQFHGNVLAHFNVGSFVSWKLYPAVLVALDSRYEVAYSAEVFDDVEGFYKQRPNWQAPLTKYPTDLALVECARPIATLMRTQTNWTRVYKDDSFELYARPGLDLPHVDRSGQPIVATYP